MTPFADFTFFGISLFVVIPTLVLGWWGRANARWAAVSTLLILLILLCNERNAVEIRPNHDVLQIWVILGYAAYQGLVTWGFLHWPTRMGFYLALGLTLLPLVSAKFLPILQPETLFGFLGISYVTFRALDVIFSIHDRVLKTVSPAHFFNFLFFFPTLASGPIDRYRRFGQDWNRIRGRQEFLDDLDGAVERVFRGFLYKFILAALIKTHWLDHAASQPGILGNWNYMYAYTAYLFFDFAGYSAFAIGFSRLLGFKTPENFDRPFLSRNIRDFWNRWHMSLSFWFRDHVYMRFLLAAGKGKWFKGKHTASYVGLFLTFGLMGIWHGIELHYILYGIYHAVLLCGYDVFNRWNKQHKHYPDGTLWRGLNICLTIHAVAFGLLLFSGHITPHPPPAHEEVADKVDCEEITGWVWDRRKPNTPLTVAVWVDRQPVAQLEASEYREDLAARKFGDGRHGFRFAVPEWMRDGRSRTVELKVLESGRVLRGTPEIIVCAPAPASSPAPAPAPASPP